MPTTSKKRFLGRQSKLYLGSAWETPTWTGLDTRDTLAVKLGTTKEDVTAEDSGGDQWEQNVLRTVGVDFTAFFNEDGISDPTYAALEAAQAANTPLVIAIADGPIDTTGTKYRKLDLYVGEISDQRDAKGVGKITVALFLGPTVNTRTTITVTGE